MSAPPRPRRPRVMHDCHDITEQWNAVQRPELLDPTPVDDLEQAGYDPAAAGRLDMRLDSAFGPFGGAR